MKQKKLKGFTLVEIAVVLLVISILLGYTVAMLPRQQELKQFKTAKKELTQITESIYAFAQINNYLPCPATVNTSDGFECRTDGTAGDGGCDGSDPETESCGVWGGFVPAKTLGIAGKYSNDGLLLDPWGRPYHYRITDDDEGGSTGEDFVIKGEMKVEGMDKLSPDLFVCNAATATADECDDESEQIAGKVPVVILSGGKNQESTTLQNENTDNDEVFISASFSDNFDDLVQWISPNILYSKMIEAEHLP